MVTDGVLLVRDGTHGEPGVIARGIDVRLDRLEAASPRGWTDAAFIVRMTAYGTTVFLAGRPGVADDLGDLAVVRQVAADQVVDDLLDRVQAHAILVAHVRLDQIASFVVDRIDPEVHVQDAQAVERDTRDHLHAFVDEPLIDGSPARSV